MFCLKDDGLLTHECVSEGEGLRKEILSKDEKRLELEFSTYCSSSLLHATFRMPPYEPLYSCK